MNIEQLVTVLQETHRHFQASALSDPDVQNFVRFYRAEDVVGHDRHSFTIARLDRWLRGLGTGWLRGASSQLSDRNDQPPIDLVLYNRLLRCHVLLDLKLDKLDHGDLGQMQMDVIYFDRHVKLDDELPTVGIVLCVHNNKAMVELTLPDDATIFASKYQLYFPSNEELKRELEKIEAEIDEFGLEAGE